MFFMYSCVAVMFGTGLIMVTRNRCVLADIAFEFWMALISYIVCSGI